MTATLRGYQEDAVSETVATLRTGGRGQIRAACGTGKTLVALRAAERLVPASGLIVLLAPSIALVAQTLAAWEADAEVPFRGRAVCSDETVAGIPMAGVEDLVTTDPEVIRGWMTRPGRKVIVGTYQSLPALAAALRDSGATADLLICDEAHRLAGPPGKAAAAALDERLVPARRRLFLTATPRLCWSENAPGLSMDDEGLFGPVLYDYQFAQAIEDGWLDDYRVAVIGVTDEEIRALLGRNDGREYVDSSSGVALPVVAAQIALARAAREHGIRRAVTFHSRVAAAREFARTMEVTIRQLPQSLQPETQVTALHIDGEMNAAQRERVLDSLRDPPYGGWTAVSNARCLTEGIDVPAIDAVLFASPRDSVVDVAQAVGRALRRHPDGTGTATIIVPVVVSGDAETDLESGAFETVWRVVRAMREHDETLATSLDFARVHWKMAASGVNSGDGIELPGRISIHVSGMYASRLAASLSLAIIQHASSKWWEGYAAASTYAAEHGDLMVPQRLVNDDGFAIGAWVRQARKDHAQGCLPPERIEALEKIGMIWNMNEAAWEDQFAAAAEFAHEHGHLNTGNAYVTDSGVKLGRWLLEQRQRQRDGKLPEARRQRLDEIGMDWALKRGPTPGRGGLERAREYRAAHGNLDIPYRYADAEGFKLGKWLATRRTEARKGTIDPATARELEALGMRWR